MAQDACGIAEERGSLLMRERHGHAAKGHMTSEYFSWANMKARCLKRSTVAWHHYGGRGIKVCDRWLTFVNFLADMGLKPTPQHSIDRINPNGNYEPGNCRWATRSEQAKNRRPVFITDRMLATSRKNLKKAWKAQMLLTPEQRKEVSRKALAARYGHDYAR